MPTPDNALQAAIFKRLTTYAPLTAALGGPLVFDFVPPGTPGPYVVIGDDTTGDLSTKTEAGWDCTLTLHAWDFEKAGRKSVKALLSHLYDALHRQEPAVPVAGFHLAELRFDGFQATLRDPSAEGDGFYHGVARYRALLTT